ncbi:MAG: 30S ribosomal protein S3 [Elusimicrobia bacterium CG08_land_8_20_14_0_20_44_26]|nr:MAG: 30S ribosomal protein S3 [Elusimicrobia bacterium CG08_land_8_20_14_0_20_44_26]
MGQKVHPLGMRIGINADWRSRWFMKKGFAASVMEDVKIRQEIEKKLDRTQISKIEIEKASSQIVVTIHTARPGLVIGQKGVTIDALREDLSLAINKEVKINVSEIKKPFLDAQIVSEMIAIQLEKKMPFRSVCKRMLKNVMDEGSMGVKVMVSGRLGGNEIARKEWFKDGSVPLQTISKKIDYGFSKAYTRYGIIGVKVWINKPEISEDKFASAGSADSVGGHKPEEIESPKGVPDLADEDGAMNEDIK